MVEEQPTIQNSSPKMEVDANPNPSEMTNGVTIQSNAPEHSESSIKNPDSSAISTVDDCEKSLAFADDLMEKGNLAFKEGELPEATDLFSRALEIRVAHYGELAPECVKSYYKFGLALLYKAQEEADPLGSMPKKDAESRQGSFKIESASSSQQQDTDDANNKDEVDGNEEGDTEVLAETEEEEESDLDLAWKMLDLARAISEKHCRETMDMVDILSALAEVSLEREDIETSLSDYEKALTIAERLVEPDSRHIADLNFRICLCLEVGSKAQEAIPYCEKAVSICKSRMQRLVDELKGMPGSTTSASSDAGEGPNHSSITSDSKNSVSDKQAEIQTLKALSSDLEKKLEDLHQLVSNPTSILSDILGLAAAKARAKEQTSASAGASSLCVGGVVGNGNSVHTNGTNGYPIDAD